MKKRVFSALLVFCMLLTMIPPAFAAMGEEAAAPVSALPEPGLAGEEFFALPADSLTAVTRTSLTGNRAEEEDRARSEQRLEAWKAARREEEEIRIREARERYETLEKKRLEVLAERSAQTAKTEAPLADSKNKYLNLDSQQTCYFVEVDEKVTLDVRVRDESWEDLNPEDLEELTFQWYDGDTGKTVNSTSASYTTAKITRNRSYYCKVTDSNNDMYQIWFYVCVNNDLSVSSDGDDWAAYVKYGKTGTLKVRVNAKDTEGITYQWYRYDSDGNRVAIEGATAASFTTPVIKQNRNFCCEVKDRFGNTSACDLYVRVDNELAAVSAATEDWWETRSASLGEKTTLQVKVTALDTSKLTYRWERQNLETFEWKPLSSTSNKLITGEIRERREYRCVIADQFENTAEVWFTIFVDNNLSLVSTRNDLTWDNRYVSPNAKETLKVKVTAADRTGLTYTWFRGYYNSDGDFIEKEQTDVTGTSLTTVAIKKYNRYRCLVSDQYGNSAEVYFELFVDNHLDAVSTRTGNLDDSRRVDYGSTATLKVKATADDTAGLTYQWRREYVKDTGEYVSTTLSGETGASLTTAAIKKHNDYICTVRDQYGTTVSVYFSLDVENHLKAVSAGNNLNYDSRDVKPGSTQTLKVNVTADNTTGLTYTWTRTYYKDSGEFVYRPVSDAAGASLTTVAINRYNQYTCQVTDKFGNYTSVVFDLRPENHLVACSAKNMAPYETRGVTPGATTTMKVDVTADNTTGITYEWFREYTKDTGDYVYKKVEGADGPSLKPAAINKHNWYHCYVSDKYGNTASVTFALYAENHLRVETDGFEIGVAYGKTASLKVKVTADNKNELYYEWYTISSSGAMNLIGGESGTSYTTPAIKKPQRFEFMATDRYGNIASTSFDVFVGNNFQAEPKDRENYIEAAYGKTATLTVKAGANNPAGITYQWYDSKGLIEGATKASYTTPAVKKAVSYCCRVKDRYQRTQYVYFAVSVRNHLQVERTTSASGCIFVNEGDTKTLKVSATADNTTGLTYRWYWYMRGASAEVPDSNKPSITTDRINGEITYQCEVQDKYGNQDVVNYRLVVGAFADQKPADILPTRTEGGMQIMWAACPGATKYQIQRKAGSAASWTTIATVASDVFMYLDKTAKAGTDYKYAVRCVRSGTYSKRAISEQVTCKKMVEGIRLTQQNTQIKLSWKALSGAATYNVMRRSFNCTTCQYTDWKAIKTGLKGTAFTDTSVESGVEYYYSVQGVTSGGTKYYYDRMIPGIFFVTAPKLSEAAATTSGVKLTWAARKGTGRYAILRKASGETSWTRVGITNQLSYTDTTAVAGKKYTYTVRSMDVQGKIYVSKHNTNGLTVTAK